MKDLFVELTEDDLRQQGFFGVSQDKIRQNAHMTRSVQPDQAASDQVLGEIEGLPSGVVTRNRDQVRSSVESREISDKSDSSVGVQEYLSDINNMAVSRDDVDNLVETESIFKQYLVDPAKALAKLAPRTAFIIDEGAANIIAMGAGLADLTVQDIGYYTGTEPGGAFKELQNWALSVAKADRDVLQGSKLLGTSKELKGKRLWDNPELILDPEWVIQNTGDAVASMIPTIVATFLSGGSNIIGGSIGGLMEAGSLYNQMLEEGETSQATAMQASLSYGIVSSVLNKLGLDKMLAKIPATTLLKRAGKHGASGLWEAFTEWLEEPSQALIKSSYEGGSFDDIVGEVGTAMTNIDVIVGAFFGGGGTSFVSNLAQEQQASQDVIFFEALDGLAENSKTRERLPEAYTKAVESILKENGGKVESIYVRAELFQSVVPEEQLQDILEKTGTEKQFKESLATGGDLAIPIAKYTSHIAGTDISAAIRGDIRFRKNGVSVNEAEQVRKEQIEKFQKEIESFEAEEEVKTQFETERQQVYDDVLTKRLAVGRVGETAKSDAEYWASFVTTYAQRHGGTPLSVYGQINPEVRAERFKAEPTKDIIDQEAQISQGLQQAQQELSQQTGPAAPASVTGFMSERGLAAQRLQDRQKGLQEGETLDFEERTILDDVIALSKDDVSGFQEARIGRARQNTIKRVQDFLEENPEVDAAYIEMDIKNLGKTNSLYGSALANKIYRAFADIVAANLADLGVDVSNFRHGGDEMSSVVVGADPETVDKAMINAVNEIEKIVSEIKSPDGRFLSNISHPKHKNDLTKKGTGVIFASTAIEPGIDMEKDIISIADQKLEERKKGDDHGYNQQIKTAWTQSLGKPAGGAEQSNAAQLGRELEESLRGAKTPESQVEERVGFPLFQSDVAADASVTQASEPIEDSTTRQVEMTNDPNIGGSTFSSDNRDLGGTDYVAVSMFPDLTETIDTGVLTPEELDAFKAKHKRLVSEFPALNFGTWADPESGKVYLDLSIRVRKDQTDKAIELAKKYNQKAIFDLSTFEDIDTKGTGEVEGKLPSVKQRLGEATELLGEESRQELYQAEGLPGQAVTVPPVDPEGNMTLTHWSKQEDLESIDPDFYGKGIKGAEDKRKVADPGNWVNRSSFGIAVGQEGGYIKEPTLGPNQYEVKVKADEVYDFNTDIDGLMVKAREANVKDPFSDVTSVYEKLIKEAGYKGYWTKDPAGNLQARLFEKVEAAPQEDLLQQEPFFSQLETSIQDIKQETAPASQWLGMIKKLPIKKEEMEWVGLEPWLKEQKGKVTKQEIIDFIQANNVQVEEVVKGEDKKTNYEIESAPPEELGIDRAEALGILADAGSLDNPGLPKFLENRYGDRAQDIQDWLNENAEVVGDYETETKFAYYQLPGGENYKELLLTLPDKVPSFFDYVRSKGMSPREMSKDRELAQATRAEYAQKYKVALTRDQFSEEMREKYGREDWLRAASQEDKDVFYAAYQSQGAEQTAKGIFRSSHFDENNVLAHTRFNERTDTEGNKVLFIEEIQSDWHQEGRKRGYADGRDLKEWDTDKDVHSLKDSGVKINVERSSLSFREYTKRELVKILEGRIPLKADIDYAMTNENLKKQYEKNKEQFYVYEEGSQLGQTEDTLKDAKKTGEDWANAKKAQGTPDAPFKKSWPLLTMKRMVRYAAENGFDKVAWTPGEVQADRYDLSKQISRVAYNPQLKELEAFDLEGNQVLIEQNVEQDNIEDYIGKEPAKRLTNSKTEAGWYTISGEGLKVGGEGMKAFYDKILPAQVNKFFNKKAWGKAKATKTDISPEDRHDLGPVRDKAWEALNGQHALTADLEESLDVFVRSKGTDKEAIDNVNEALDFINAEEAFISEKASPFEAWTLDITPEMKEKSTSEGLPLFQDQPTTRGAVNRFQLGETPVVKLFEAANPSTFLHESMHIFTMFMQQTAEQPNAPKELVADWNTLLEHVGSKGGPLTTEQLEKLAETGEAYFMEGKAPSNKLRQVFRQFSDWLKSIYQQSQKLDIDINPEVKKVFDRMFASDEEIAEAQQFYDAQKPFFTEADLQNKRDQAKYAKLRNKVDLEAKDERFQQYNKAYLQAQGGKQGVEKQVTEEINAMPVYASMDAAVNNGGISIEMADDIMGVEARKELGKKRPGLFKKEGDVVPDKLAQENGYTNSEEMFAAMTEAATKTDLKKTMTTARLAALEKTVRDSLAEENHLEADPEYHSDSKLTLLIAEIEMIAKHKSRKSGLKKAASARIEISAIRDVARQVLEKKTVGEASGYFNYSRAEAKAARQARKAYTEGDFEKAELFKRRELLNHALVIESVAVKAEVQKSVKAVNRKANSKAVVEPEIDLIKDVVVRFGFKPRQPKMSHDQTVQVYNAWISETDANGKPRKKIDYNQWVRTQEEKGYGVVLADEVTDRTNATQYKDLPVETFRRVVDSVKQLATVELRERQVKVGDKIMALDDVADTLVGQLVSTYKPKAFDRFGGSKKKMLSNIDAHLVKMEFLFEAIDGGEIGVWHETIFQKMAEAEENENIQVLQADKDIKKIFDAQYTKSEQKKLFSTKVLIPEIGASPTKAQVLRMALDFGNRDNYIKRRDGENWNDAQMEAVKNKLTKKDWDFLQSTWDYIEQFKEPSFKLEKEMTGRTPASVTPNAIDTPFGTYAGGYFPISFDARESTTARSRQQKEQALLYNTPNYSHAMTKHGFLEGRKATAGGQALSLELTDVTRHVTGVIHDLTHREAVVDVAKILRHDKVEAALVDYLGPETQAQFMPWLKDIANTDPTHDMGEKIAKGLRIGTTVAKLGKFGVMFQQLAGTTQSIHVLGKQSWRLPEAYIKLFANPFDIEEQIGTIMDKSKFMKTRITNYSREAHDSFKGLNVYKKAPQALGEFAMQGIGILQFMTDAPTWAAAYNAGIAAHGNEKKAVTYADSVVRKSQGGGGVKDLARVQRGNEYFRLMTMFYSFMNVAYNVFSKTGRGKSFNYGELSSAILFVGLLGPMAAEILSGRPPDAEDDEDWLSWTAKVEARFYSGLFPVFRDIAGAAGSGFDYRVSPVESPVSTIVKGTRQAIIGQDLTKLIKPIAEVGGLGFRIPSDQILRTTTAFYEWLNDNPDFEYNDLIYGGKYE